MKQAILNIPKYDNYKDSGSKWMGKVPNSWEVTSLGSLLKLVSEKNHPDLQLLSITREQGVIVRDIEDQKSNHNFIPDDLSNYKKIKKGQFGMNKMKAWQGSYGVSNHTGIVSPAYYIFDFTKKIVSEYFHWAIRSKLYVSYFASASDGVRIGQWDLSKARMRFIPFLIPNIEEQKAITKFLDYKTKQIDEAIDIKKKQIALLKERKKIIIQKTVISGLDLNASKKNSSVNWIDDIPAHWDIKPLISETKLKFITNCAKRELLSVYLDFGVIKFSDVDEKRTNATSLDLSGYQAVDPGDFVLNNQQAWRGSVGVSKFTGIISPAYIVLTLSKKFNIDYANYLFRSSAMVAHYLQASKGVGTIQRNLYWQYVKRMPVFIPPMREQEKIVSYIREKTDEIDLAIKSQDIQINKLKEYKISLINGVVTGKIKVI